MTHDVLLAAQGRGVDILTTEGKILNYLGANEHACVKEVMLDIGTSYRGFYMALDRLKIANVVRSEVSAKDKRVRYLHLNLDAS